MALNCFFFFFVGFLWTYHKKPKLKSFHLFIYYLSTNSHHSTCRYDSANILKTNLSSLDSSSILLDFFLFCFLMVQGLVKIKALLSFMVCGRTIIFSFSLIIHWFHSCFQCKVKTSSLFTSSFDLFIFLLHLGLDCKTCTTCKKK